MMVAREDIIATLSGLSPEARVKALRKALADVEQDNARHRYPTPGDLAADLDRTTVQTPALRVIDRAVADTINNGGRLIITMPPQEGKSTRVAVWAPVWALMRDPDARIVVASYAETLAARNAYQARAIVNEHGSGAVDEVTGAALPDRLGIAVARDNRQQRSWGISGTKGGYYATGTGGSLTGRAADCVSGDTVIITEHGPVTAEEAFTNPPERVLSYNHEKRRPEWRHLEACRRITGRRVVTVETEAGNVLTCTPDHLVYAGGRYTPAGDLRAGEAVLLSVSGDGVPPVRHTVCGDGCGRAEGDPSWADTSLRRPVLHRVEGGERADTVLRGVRRPCAEVPEDDVQRPVCGGCAYQEGHVRELSVVREEGTGEKLPDPILRHDVRGQGTLRPDDGEGEQSPHAVIVPQGGVQPPTPLRKGEGREPVCCVRRNVEPACASPERGLGGQPDGEPCDGMCGVSHGAPRVSEGTVSRVTTAGVTDVYDFQVEGNENFFANGILVHNCLIIDDPFKNQTQADSAREREKVWEWWTSVAQTRLAPGAAVVIIMTRWHEDDLVGAILAEEEKRPAAERYWEVLNIPAVAEDGVPDALGREPGVSMVSARGRTKGEFDRIRHAVGPRVWSALYQGQPTPSEGGMFSREEFDRGRVEGVDLAGRIVSIDPAESGTGDEAGLLLMGWDANGIVYVEEDHSGRMTSAVWARSAVRLALEKGATDILYEAFTAEQTYRDVMTSTWREIHRQAVILRQNGLDTVTAAEQWHNEGQAGDTLTPMQRTLEIIDLIPEQDVMPFRLVPWRKRGDKVARAAGARQSVTTGRLRMVGHHKVLERQGATWQAGQGSPDRVDAMVNGHDHILSLFGQAASIALPGDW